MRSLFLFLALTLATPAFAMDVKSHDIADGAMLSTQQVYTDCNGDNVSPGVFWSGAPAGTKSFAVTLYDPDADFWHWTAFDIPATATSIVRGASATPTLLPAGTIQGRNDFARTGYGGACPPPGSGKHHYQFTVWALDSDALPFDSNAGGGAVGAYLKQHALAQATLTAIYQR
ncbi:MAG TPA: YbhB/YbcL family Raf kinase inhibitor-like protein [Rhizomicrobium sp.]|jgi:hypothetical protein|nr:YbhB/YbcL family Raf kinase inhibitor-like protein [Rhizomicrobium sp.]